jgi:hypothetical protein
VADSGTVPLPEIREVLFADLPPLTVLEQFAAVPELYALAGAVAREDGVGARPLLDRVLDTMTESRIRLQAWSLARRVGIEPGPEEARQVRGVVIDVGLDEGTDTLAGYDDGTARYLNQGGGAIVWEARDEAIGAVIRELIAAGQAVAERTGPLDGPRPAAPPAGYAAIWLLADGGIHLGAGPFQTLATDPLGGPVIGAGTDLMRQLIERDSAARN